MMYQVDSEDANFLYLENADSPTHISLIYLYDQSSLGEEVVRLTDILRHIGNRLNSAPVFRQKILRTPANIDYPYWIDDDEFDIEFHVRHLALPKPGDWRQFCIQIARLHSRPLDMSRPLWELYVIEGLDNLEGFPNGCFALYFKVHHCAMDEFTALELVESLHQRTAKAKPHKQTVQQVTHLPATAPPLPEMLARGVINSTIKTLRLSYQSATNLRTVSRMMTRMSLGFMQRLIDGSAPSGSPETRFGGQLTASRVFDGGFYEEQLLDQYIQAVPGATHTHGIAAICGEALRLYLEAHDELGKESLSALLEVNVRNAGAHALAGNRIAVKQMQLNTTIAHPIDRLRAIVSTNPEIDSIDDTELTSFKLRSLYENVPAPLLALLGKRSNQRRSLNRRLMLGANCGITQIQGSPDPLYFLGAKLLGFTSVTPLYSGCGLMFTASTYGDRLGLTFTSDRSMMRDPEFMRECLDSAFIAIGNHLQGMVDHGADV